jgi:hypothetical protein
MAYGGGLCAYAVSVGCSVRMPDGTTVGERCPAACHLCAPTTGAKRCDAPVASCSVTDLGALTAASCPPAPNGAYIPPTCPMVCAAAYTQWWGGCQASSDVAALDAMLGHGLRGFYELCRLQLDCSAAGTALSSGGGH